MALGRLDDSGTLLPDVHLRGYDGSLDHAERALGEVRALMAAAGVGVAEVVAVAAGVGPGSFTGVRVGVTTAKALAWLTRSRLVAVSSLEVMARGYRGSEPGARVAVIDARRDELFVAAYDERGGELLAPEHVRRGEAVGRLRSLGPGVVLGEVAIEGLGPSAGEPGLVSVRADDTDLPGPLALLELGAERLRAGAVVDAATLAPTYLRPPDAALPASALSLAPGPRVDSARHG